MSILNRASKPISDFFGKTARKLAAVTRFVQRESKMSGPLFLKTLVCGWSKEPNASLNDLADMADDLGVEITGQGIDDRINEQAVDFMQQQFAKSIEILRNDSPVEIEILQQFCAVELLDSTTIALPDILGEEYPGCGGDGPDSSLKVQLVFNWLDGTIKNLIFQTGKTPDQAYSEDINKWLPGTLRITDLGYFKMGRFVEIDSADSYFLTRLNTQTALFSLEGLRIDLLEWLQTRNEQMSEDYFLIGSQTKLRCRVVAVRLPQEVADRRRQKAIQKAKKKGRTLSARSLALLSWTIFMTNVPTVMLNTKQVTRLYPLRWQIELIFKLWKSEFALDRVAGLRRERVLVELYAKLIGVVVVHFLQAPFRFTEELELSLIKSARVIRRRAISIAISLTSIFTLNVELNKLTRKILRFGAKNKRKTNKSTSYLLYEEMMHLDDEEALALAA